MDLYILTDGGTLKVDSNDLNSRSLQQPILLLK